MARTMNCTYDDMLVAKILLELPELVIMSEFKQAWSSSGATWGARKRRSCVSRQRLAGKKRKSPDAEVGKDSSQGSSLVLKSGEPRESEPGGEFLMPDLNIPIVDECLMPVAIVNARIGTNPGQMVLAGNDNAQVPVAAVSWLQVGNGYGFGGWKAAAAAKKRREVRIKYMKNRKKGV